MSSAYGLRFGFSLVETLNQSGAGKRYAWAGARLGRRFPNRPISQRANHDHHHIRTLPPNRAAGGNVEKGRVMGEQTKSATLSDCGRYRYRLERKWSDQASMLFIMLNPSIADASTDDPTIRRCVGFAKRDGCGGVVVVNLFGLRATDPDEISRSTEPFGPGNEAAQQSALDEAQEERSPIVCAWGASLSRQADVRFLALARKTGAPLMALGFTKTGHPRHPLYVRGDQPLLQFGSRP